MTGGTAPFADLLRGFRDRAELVQEALAERAGLSPDAVGLLERGERRRPHTDTVARLAAALELSAAERAQFESAARRPAPLVAQAAAPQLPLARTTLVGRAAAIDTVIGLLSQPAVRLVTLTGPGGVGKTRLALAVAEQLDHAFADGVVFVPLATLRTPDLVLATIATALGVRERLGQTQLERLTQALQLRLALLVLDNFEHLLAAAPLVSALLAACPRLAVLATSRAPLHLAGEHQFAVPPLDLPAAWQEAPLEQLGHVPVIAMFQQRAQAVVPGFAVTVANGETVLAICRRLDGLPLAIELAAAWIRLLPQILLERLDRRLPLLIGGPRDLPERQQTLHNTILWSYDLLSAEEQALLRRLAVFVGGFTLAAAEAVGATEDGPDSAVLAELASLIDASLLQSFGDAPLVWEETGAPRYALLETVREFALEQLQAHGEFADAHQRLVQYFVALAQAASAEWDGPKKALWLDRFQDELDNFRAALVWAREHDDAETLLRLTEALWKFWDIRGHLSEGRAWTHTALSVANGRADLLPLQAQVIEGAGFLAFHQSDYEQARASFCESLNLYRLLEDEAEIASALNDLGLVVWHLGDYPLATAHFEQSLQSYRSAGHQQGVAWVLGNLGIICYEHGDYAQAGRYGKQSLALKRELGDTQGIAQSLNNLGNIAYGQCDFTTAQALYAESLALKRDLNNKLEIPSTLVNIAKIARQHGEAQTAQMHAEEALTLWRDLGGGQGIASTLGWLGRIACEQGAYDRARALLQESLAIWKDVDNKLFIIETLEAIACLLAAQGVEQQALYLFAATDALRSKLSSPIAPVERPFRDRPIAMLHAHLDATAFAAAWSASQAMTLEQAIAYAVNSIKA